MVSVTPVTGLFDLQRVATHGLSTAGLEGWELMHSRGINAAYREGSQLPQPFFPTHVDGHAQCLGPSRCITLGHNSVPGGLLT